MERIEILGVGVDRVTEQEAVERCAEFIATGSPHLVFTPNSEMIMEARENPELFQALAGAQLVVPDGMGVVWASRILGKPLPQRVTGIDLFSALCQEGAKRSWRFFLLGAKPTVAEKAAEELVSINPGLEIVGTQDGYFTSEEEPEILAQIKALSPDILAVGLGAPRQELWLEKWLPELGVPVGIGIGGSFDVFAGEVKRAPDLVAKLGFEWAYRLVKEPWRLPRMMALPKFAVKVCGERLGVGRSGQKSDS